jgi:hypothetical protein
MNILSGWADRNCFTAETGLFMDFSLIKQLVRVNESFQKAVPAARPAATNRRRGHALTGTRKGDIFS